MTIDAKQKRLLIEDLTLGLPAAASTLRTERRKFSAHVLTIPSFRHVYETLSEVADSLDILNVTLIDLFLTEGIEMNEKTKEMEQQIGRQAAHPGAAQEAEVPADAKTDQTSAEATSSPAQEATKRIDPTLDTPQSVAETILSALTALSQVLEAMPDAIGIRNVVTQLDRIQNIVTTNGIVFGKLAVMPGVLDRIEQKFIGIGKAIDVIAQATQRNMPGNNGAGDEQGG